MFSGGNRSSNPSLKMTNVLPGHGPFVSYSIQIPACPKCVVVSFRPSKQPVQLSGLDDRFQHSRCAISSKLTREGGGAAPSPHTMGFREKSSDRGVDHSNPSSAKVKNMSTFIPTLVFILNSRLLGSGKTSPFLMFHLQANNTS
jgi:hypothetical protein